MEMLMYGTLRDFERGLEIAAGHRRDNQMTIDQLVDAFLPESPGKLDKNEAQASE
ncbi:MAG: hypothetical protein ACOX1A_02095 [Saccharofermentanales bacterium]